MAYLTQTQPVFAPLSARMVALRTQLGEYLTRRKLYRTTYNELASLSNHELADIGISRAMIGSIAFETAYGK